MITYRHKNYGPGQIFRLWQCLMADWKEVIIRGSDEYSPNWRAEIKGCSMHIIGFGTSAFDALGAAVSQLQEGKP